MENGFSGKEETKEGVSRQDLNNQTRNKTEEEIFQELVSTFNNMFQYENLLNNSYLVHRTNISFDIDIKVIYEEFTVKSITSNEKLINQALEATDNVIVKKRGDTIETVRPKKNTLRITLRINNLNKSDSDELKQIAIGFIEGADQIKWDFNHNIGIVTVVCKNEQTAETLYNKLSTLTFKGNQLDVALSEESLYISASDNIMNRKKGSGYGGRPFMNPYQMNFYNPYMYPAPMYGNMQGGYSGGGYNKGGYKRGGKFGGGKRGSGKYSRGGYKKNDANFEVTEQDFPRLGEGNEE
jgi:hypothetical protein